MDQLTSGIQRIKLKMPTKEEHDAREKQKALEAEKKAATKSTTRKAPPARTKSTKAVTTTAKKALGRSTKSSKPASPVEPLLEKPLPVLEPVPAVVPSPEPPQIQSAVSPPLEQPQPMQPEQAPSVIASVEPPEPVRQSSIGLMEPPTELMEMVITPDLLPKPSVMNIVDPLPVRTSPPRPDTPPPPPPSLPDFVHFNRESFQKDPTVEAAEEIRSEQIKSEPVAPQAPLQWMPPNSESGRPMSPASKRQDLPVFTAHGAIPFASNPNIASNTALLADLQNASATVKSKVEATSCSLNLTYHHVLSSATFASEV